MNLSTCVNVDFESHATRHPSDCGTDLAQNVPIRVYSSHRRIAILWTVIFGWKTALVVANTDGCQWSISGMHRSVVASRTEADFLHIGYWVFREYFVDIFIIYETL